MARMSAMDALENKIEKAQVQVNVGECWYRVPLRKDYKYYKNITAVPRQRPLTGLFVLGTIHINEDEKYY